MKKRGARLRRPETIGSQIGARDEKEMAICAKSNLSQPNLKKENPLAQVCIKNIEFGAAILTSATR